MPDGTYFSTRERAFQEMATSVYRERVDNGVARKDQPLSTYTEAYWKCNLHNLLHFLGLRMDSHAQQEIRQYATTIGERIVAPMFPSVWEAFLDYRMNAVTISALDIAVAPHAMRWAECESHHKVRLRLHSDICWLGCPEDWRGKGRCRERDECIEKLKGMGVLPNGL